MIIEAKVLVNSFTQDLDEMRASIDKLREVAGGEMTAGDQHVRRDRFKPEDQMEESSYSVYLARSSRYLAEVLSACYAHGLGFEIHGGDNVGYVYYNKNGETKVLPIQDALTPATIAESVADALADVLVDVIDTEYRGRYVPLYVVQVVIVNGAFQNAHTGIEIAENVQYMGEFLKQFPNIMIEIVSAYD